MDIRHNYHKSRVKSNENTLNGAKYIVTGVSGKAFLNMFITIVQEGQILLSKGRQLGWRGSGK